MQCRDFREIACSFLDDELLVETNHEVIRHMETCADCRGELTARGAFRVKMRSAIAHAPGLEMTEDFVTRLRAQLRTRTRQRRLSTIFMRVGRRLRRGRN